MRPSLNCQGFKVRCTRKATHKVFGVKNFDKPLKQGWPAVDSAGFNVGRWDHWLLVISFVGIASYGLWLSWQWRIAPTQKRTPAYRARALRSSNRRTQKALKKDAAQRQLARQLATQVHAQQQNRHAP